MLHSLYKQISLCSLFRAVVWPDKSVNAAVRRGVGRERGKEGAGNAKSCVKRDFVAGLSGESQG